jgi:hypothetical protein
VAEEKAEEEKGENRVKRRRVWAGVRFFRTRSWKKCDTVLRQERASTEVINCVASLSR